MFATLLGALPRPDGAMRQPANEPRLEAAIAAVIAAQEAAGLEPVTDGRLRGELIDWVGPDGQVDADAIVGAWTSAAGSNNRAVKQALPGPYSVGRRFPPGSAEAARAALRAAESLHDVVAALAAAGCPMIEIEETEAHRIGADERERALFRDAHRRLTDRLEGTHLSLSIVGGSAWEAGLETILDAPYSSLAVDLIAGPDNWNLVTRYPGDRGVIAGALPAMDSPADAKEMLLWAARYAAGSNGRGLDRVGIGSAGSWANLTWVAAEAKLRRLGEAVRLAQLPGGNAAARELDPRAVSARAAATGRVRPDHAQARSDPKRERKRS